MKRIVAIAGAALLGLGITAAYAEFSGQGEGFAPQGGDRGGMRDGRGGGMLERLDTDGDGKVSRAEYEAHFSALDADGDGYVTREEFVEARDERRTERRDKMFTRDDADSDGMLSRDEFSGPSKMFAKIDADNDGYISKQEAEEFRPVRDRMRRGGQGGRCMDGGQRGPGGPGGPEEPED